MKKFKGMRESLKGNKEATELDEAIDFRKAHQEIMAYAKKSGGIDKTDFEKVAYYVKAIGDNQNSPNVANKAFMTMKKFIADMDTDPRDGVLLMLKKHGMFKNGRMVQESTDVSENLNPQQIALLKKNYSTIDRIDPTGPAYKKAKGMISGLEKDNLIDLAKAKVKWLSQIAADELRKQHNVKLKASEYMESVKESTINELTTVDREKLVKVFDKLKKGSTVKIKSNDSIKKGDDYIEFVVKSKSTVRRGEVEKITLANKGNPTGVNRFLYKRVDTSTVSFAVGDMAASIVDIKESTELEEKGKGLWHNIRKKRERGEPKAKPGDKDYPKTLDIDEAIGKLPANASREDKIRHTVQIMKKYAANKGKSENELRKGAIDYLDQFINKNKKTDAYIAKMKSKKESVELDEAGQSKNFAHLRIGPASGQKKLKTIDKLRNEPAGGRGDMKYNKKKASIKKNIDDLLYKIQMDKLKKEDCVDETKEPALKSSDYPKGTSQSAQAFKDKFAKKKKESVDEKVNEIAPIAPLVGLAARGVGSYLAKKATKTIAKNVAKRVAVGAAAAAAGAGAAGLAGAAYAAKKAKDKLKNKEKKESVDEAKTNWKMGDGRPRNGARIENDRFWNLPYDSLKYIAKDAGDAMKANPTARKATTGPGNWADQVADAATVMQWRKKNGIKESDEGVEEASILKTTHKNVTNKKSVEKDRKKAVKTLADIRKGKYAGVKMANEDHDSSCVTESMELGELTTQQMIKKLGADTIFKKKYSAAADKVKEIMFKHGDKPRHSKEYYAGKIARQVDLDPHILALMVD